MTNLSDLPAEIRREILIHAVSVRGLERGLRLRLLNKEFSQQVKSVLYRSRILEDYQERWWTTKPESEAEFDAFWQPYLTNKIMRKNWDNTDLDERIYRATERFRPDMTDDARRRVFRQMSHLEKRSKEKLHEVDLYERIYRAAERLRQISHPDERSKEILHEVLKQYIHAFCWHPRRILKRARFKSKRFKICPFSDPLYFLEMALVNDCQEGIRSALNDPAVDDMLSHSLECRSVYLCNHYIVTTATERGNIAFLAKIFSSPKFQQKPKGLRGLAFEAAVGGGQLDVVRFIMEPHKHWPDFDPIDHLVEDAIRSGVLKSRSVDFCFQLFGLLASRLKIPTRRAKNPQNPHDAYNRYLLEKYLGYDNVLRIVAHSSPQRADVAEWLLDHGASASLTAEEKRNLAEATQTAFHPPLEHAVKGGNEKIVRLLLDRGAGLKAVEATWYYREAARRGRLDIVRILVEYGARVAPRLPLTCRELHWRCGLMMHAVPTENEGLCRYLAEHGTCVSNSALEAAIDGSMVSMVKLLLGLGVVVTEHNIGQAKHLGRSEVTMTYNPRVSHQFRNPYAPSTERGSRMRSIADMSNSEVIALLQAHNISN